MRGGDEHAKFLLLMDSKCCADIDVALREELIALHFASIHNAYQQGHQAGRLTEKQR